MKWLIYKHTSCTSNKSYIGVTKHTVSKRLGWHLTEMRGGSESHFHNALRKYGKGDFISDILEDNLSKVDAFNKESIYITHFDTYKNGYNMTTGGDSGPTLFGKENGMYNKKHTPIAKKAISDKKKLLIGDKHPHYGKISPLKGKTYEEIVGHEKALILKEERSNALKGIKRPYNEGDNNPAKRNEVRKKISEARSNPVTINKVTYKSKRDACKKLSISLYKLNQLLEK